jgi:3',5'-cyclic AMP phosphodiesterase CpdA
MRLAHFSDVHITRPPLSQGFELKRWAAMVSYTGFGRARRFAGSDQRLAALLADIDGQSVDHALCTGDLTGVAGSDEFARAADVFGARLHQPERLTVLPGNHDRYLKGGNDFDRHFKDVCPAAFPSVKQLAPNVALVTLDVCRPTSVIDSSGLVGERQLADAQSILTDRALRDQFVVLALHYGLLRRDGTRDSRSHGLRDDEALLQLLALKEVNCDLILHGHLHRPFHLEANGRLVVNAGSATDLHVPCGYQIFTIDPLTHTVVSERREWAAGRFQVKPKSSLVFTRQTRRRVAN